MRAPFRLIAGCLFVVLAVAAVAVAGHAPTFAQQKAAKKTTAAKQKSGKRKSVRQKAPSKSATGTGHETAVKKAQSTPETSGLPQILTPQPSPEEIEHTARYDKATASVRSHDISSEDAARIREAFAAIAAGNPSKAKALRADVRDPVGAKLIDWYAYRNGYGTAAEIRAFLDANPTWPDRGTLTQRAEEVLFTSEASPADVKAFFADTPPMTAVGFTALAWALVADKDEATAKVLAAKVWAELEIPARWEEDVLKRIGGLLTEADHKRRLDRLFVGGSRSTRERNARAAIIKRTIAQLSAPERKKAEARLAVFQRSKGSQKLIDKLPPEVLAKEWGLAFQRAQALRRQGKEEEAWKLLLAEPEPTLTVRPDGWWEECRANAYAALRAGSPRWPMTWCAIPASST
jgi:soluble lytic murein transglycosylase